MKENIIMTPPRKYLFLDINQINNPLNKKYNILPYSTQIIKNENHVFDLLHLLGNKKKYFLLKKIYEDGKTDIKKKLFAQTKKEKKYINLNTININTYNPENINIHSPISIMEGNFISGLIDYCRNKKKRMEKLRLLKQKNKFVFKKPKLNQDIVIKNYNNKRRISNYTNENKNKSNSFSEENKEEIETNNNYIENSKSNISNNNKFNYFTINSLGNESLSLENKNEFKKIIKSIFYKNYNKLNKDKKSLSADNFFGIQSKKIKINGNYKEQNLNLKQKKLTKLFFSKLFKEENNIANNLNEINNNLLDFKYTNFLEKINSVYNINENNKNDNNNNLNKQKTLNNFHTPKKNKYRHLKENLTSFKKGLYEFPKVNKYIYGSRNPLNIFSKDKIKSKLDTNLSE